MSTKKIHLEDRHNLKINLLSNVNYYGNLKGKGFAKATKKIISSTQFEALECTSFHPETNELRSTIKIKQEAGYQGAGNQQTSYEFVRYFIDYEDNGTWEDVGVTSLKVRNISNHEGLCYGVKLKIAPSVHRKCSQSPVLPKIRAILSWEIEPPVNDPNYQPIFGHIKEVYIQIAPKKLHYINLGKFQSKTAQLKANPSFNNVPHYQLSKLKILKKLYKNELNDGRLASMTFNQTSKFNLNDFIDWYKISKPENMNFLKAFNLYKSYKFNTTYEELTCVGYNAVAGELQAHIRIKKSTGFSGDLCTDGSREYVAFYMDFGNGWKFMGTSSVKVYDIQQCPKAGLWYTTYLPVDVSKYKDEIKTNKRVKIKGILSWNQAPTPNDAEYIAKWGDWEICETDLSGITIHTSQVTNLPWMESLGGVDTDIINDSTGLAYGPSGMANNITANYSPFDGRIYVTGKLLNPSWNARYKIMIKAPNTPEYALQREFQIRITKFNLSQGTQTQQNVQQRPTNDYYKYYPKTTGNIQTYVNGNILGAFTPTESGMHELYIESENGMQSETVRFMVDKDRPQVSIEITEGTKSCKQVEKNTNVGGTFSVTNDKHLGNVRLWSKSGIGDPKVTITSVNLTAGDTNTIIENSTIINDTDSSEDVVTGTWEIEASELESCAYNVHIQATDRTIVNSHHVGKSSEIPTQGFYVKP